MALVVLVAPYWLLPCAGQPMIQVVQFSASVLFLVMAAHGKGTLSYGKQGLVGQGRVTRWCWKGGTYYKGSGQSCTACLRHVRGHGSSLDAGEPFGDCVAHAKGGRQVLQLSCVARSSRPSTLPHFYVLLYCVGAVVGLCRGSPYSLLSIVTSAYSSLSIQQRGSLIHQDGARDRLGQQAAADLHVAWRQCPEPEQHPVEPTANYRCRWWPGKLLEPLSGAQRRCCRSGSPAELRVVGC